MAPQPSLTPSRLVGFNPGSEAEPNGGTLEHYSQQQDCAAVPATEEAVDSAAPSVLNKLQKWADYEAMGAPVWPTRFIPMKTPMSTEILDNWSLAEAPRHALTVPLLLSTQAAAARRVGLIIDLANHDCLYSDDMPDSLEYEHVQLIAKVLPSREAINEVERIAKSFWGEHPDQYIAIHCAYGFNRTGFVVCSYLCQACGLSVDQALESFAAARPPGVKHEKFVRELYARYGSGAAGLADTPDGSLLGASPPAEPAVDALAAEAEWLRRNGAAASGMHAAASAPASQHGPPPPPPQQQQDAGQRPEQQSRLQQQAMEKEEDMHFEDAAAVVRQSSSHRRTLSVKSSGGAEAALPGGSPGAASSRSASRPASNASSRNPSRHGGSFAELAGIVEADNAEQDAGLATAAGSGFTASRKLLLRKTSRGGGLSQALAGGSTTASASSPGSGDPQAVEGGSPVCGLRTGTSSASDFAAAAAHLEGANSMRRATSLGLAKALCEDFLQNNGTPSTLAPIAVAAAWDEQEAAALQEAAGCPAGAAEQQAWQPQQQEQQQGQQEEQRAAGSVPIAGANPPPSGSSFPNAHGGIPAAGDSSSGTCGASACISTSPQQKPQLSSSPSRRGGIPLPPVRACSAALQQPHLQHLQQQAQPGTPLTPASSSATPVSGQPRQSGFPRSVSVDSDNPSLGFGVREALHHLRVGHTLDTTNVRGPQALADLFREDSKGEMAALDVEEHLHALALAQAAGVDSPAAAVGVPAVLGAALSAAMAREQAAHGGAPRPVHAAAPLQADRGVATGANPTPPPPQQPVPAMKAALESSPSRQPASSGAEQCAPNSSSGGKCSVQ